MYKITNNLSLEIKPWNCKICIFLNTEHYYKCSVCGNESDFFSIVNKGKKYKDYNKKSRVRRHFKTTSKVLLPVLSCYSYKQFISNIKKLYPLYQEKMINGVWLLTNNTNSNTIEKVIIWVRKNFSDLWIGVNLIGENIITILEFINKNRPDGIWNDRSSVNDEKYQNVPNIMIDQIKRLKWSGLYFGGILFKYVAVQGDKKNIVKKSSKYMDVLTTSGIGTGIPIEKKKLEFIYKTKHKNLPVAVASGITPENISDIIQYCNIFIVRSSIVDSNNNVSISKLFKLINAIKNN